MQQVHEGYGIHAYLELKLLSVWCESTFKKRSMKATNIRIPTRTPNMGSVRKSPIFATTLNITTAIICWYHFECLAKYHYYNKKSISNIINTSLQSNLKQIPTISFSVLVYLKMTLDVFKLIIIMLLKFQSLLKNVCHN